MGTLPVLEPELHIGLMTTPIHFGTTAIAGGSLPETCSRTARPPTWVRNLATEISPITMEKHMTRFKLLGATALVLSAALATPSMAKEVKTDHAKKETRMTPQRMHPRHMARTNMVRRNNDMAYRNDNHGWTNNGDWAWNDNERDTGFLPGDVAAGVVGGAVATTGAAVDTAGRIASAPFRNDGYGYNNSYAYNSNYNDNSGWNDDRRDSGFWPADAAAGVVDGAVNTAGAIATAPFRGNSYAYYNNGYPNNGYQNNGWDNGWSGQSYAQRNGFVCQPGTWFKGEDGRRHICQ
jgi:hypothetical protein